MSLPKMAGQNTIDLSLRRTLQNWVERKQPPADGKARLLQAARSADLYQRRRINFISFVLSERQDPDYVEKIRRTPLYSFQPLVAAIY